jgi:hypothetical protein
MMDIHIVLPHPATTLCYTYTLLFFCLGSIDGLLFRDLDKSWKRSRPCAIVDDMPRAVQTEYLGRRELKS